MTAPAARLDTPRLRIEISRPAHAAGLARFYRDNHDGHLAPWSPPIPPQAFTEAGWAARLEKDAADFEAGLTARWVLLPPDGGDEVIGTANLTQIFRGPFHAAMLGYQLARRHEGRGMMAEALRAVIDHAFGPLRLHRLMAKDDQFSVVLLYEMLFPSLLEKQLLRLVFRLDERVLGGRLPNRDQWIDLAPPPPADAAA